MSKLKIELKKKENPYRNEPSAPFELWGEIVMWHKERILLDAQWDITSFIEWFAEKKEYLRSETFPFEFTNSIAESRDLLFEKIDDFSDSQEQEMFDYVDYLSDYFTNHYFHLRGTKTQSFYIGLTPNKQGEISCCVEDRYFAYSFEMDEFLKATDEEIKQFLTSMTVGEGNREFFKEALSDYYPYLASISNNL